MLIGMMDTTIKMKMTLQGDKTMEEDEDRICKCIVIDYRE